jgi:hypothetical protein
MLPDEQETGHKKPLKEIEKKIIKEDREHKDRGRVGYHPGYAKDEKPKQKKKED